MSHDPSLSYDAEPLEAVPFDISEAPSPPEEGGSALEEEVTKLKALWLRTTADFDNYRKRTQRELEEARRSGKEELLRTVLPVFDNLERALQSAEQAADVKSLTAGCAMILKQLEDTLGRMQITKVLAVGHPFDPAVHDAIQQVETHEHPAGTVIAEVQAGYVQGEKLLRPAMVVVAKNLSS